MKVLSINRIALAAIALFFTVFIFSCKKEGSVQTDNLTEEEAVEYTTEGTEAEASFDDVQDVSMLAAEEEEIASAGRSGSDAGRLFPFIRLRARLGVCAEITVSPNDSTYPKTVTIDFGTTGCLCADGKFRKGKIVMHFTGRIRKPGSVVTITLVDFQLNRAKIEGTKTITNLSENGNIKYTVRVTNGKVTYPNGRGYKYASNKQIKQIDGGTTNEVEDDVFTIEGRSETSFKNGFTIVLNTETPLVKKVACNWINAGTLKIKINSRSLLLDYAHPNNGDCDNKALLTWNNKQQVIILP